MCELRNLEEVPHPAAAAWRRVPQVRFRRPVARSLGQGARTHRRVWEPEPQRPGALHSLGCGVQHVQAHKMQAGAWGAECSQSVRCMRGGPASSRRGASDQRSVGQRARPAGAERSAGCVCARRARSLRSGPRKLCGPSWALAEGAQHRAAHLGRESSRTFCRSDHARHTQAPTAREPRPLLSRRPFVAAALLWGLPDTGPHVRARFALAAADGLSRSIAPSRFALSASELPAAGPRSSRGVSPPARRSAPAEAHRRLRGCQTRATADARSSAFRAGGSGRTRQASDSRPANMTWRPCDPAACRVTVPWSTALPGAVHCSS